MSCYSFLLPCSAKLCEDLLCVCLAHAGSQEPRPEGMLPLTAGAEGSQPWRLPRTPSPTVGVAENLLLGSDPPKVCMWTSSNRRHA